MRRIGILGLCGALLVGAAPAWAAPPTRWGAARQGPVAQREADAQARAEAQLLAGRRLRRGGAAADPLFASGFLLHQQEARRILEEVGGQRARGVEVRFLHAQILGDLGSWAEAAQALEPIVEQLPASSRVDGWVELAVAYARLGRTEEEIGCYDRALALEPHGSSRATMLANQAEAFMASGDLGRAVAGYRASIEQLTPAELPALAPTTLWGLGVALDREGEAERALDSIQRARSLDPGDQRLASPGWFYNPPHDEHWYAGLGHLLVARRGPEADVRGPAYERAIQSFRAYLRDAPPDDRWLPLARAHVARIEAERALSERRRATEGPRSGARPPGRTPGPRR